jgi:ATP-dependent Lon protease
MPEGGIGKEGPSAGTAILSAFVSLFTQTKIHPDIGEETWWLASYPSRVLITAKLSAMTGEISLLGQVLPVGGLKEKMCVDTSAIVCIPDLTILLHHSLAAHRAGIKSEFAFSHTTGRAGCWFSNIPPTELIVPAACKSDIDENVPPSVKEGIEFVFVDDVRQVLHEVFANEPLKKRLDADLPLQDGLPIRSGPW